MRIGVPVLKDSITLQAVPKLATPLNTLVPQRPLVLPNAASKGFKKNKHDTPTLNPKPKTLNHL